MPTDTQHFGVQESEIKVMTSKREAKNPKNIKKFKDQREIGQKKALKRLSVRVLYEHSPSVLRTSHVTPR